MSMSPEARAVLIQGFDDYRSSFLAALDQMTAELRPLLEAMPNFYQESIINCAFAFSDVELVRDQLVGVEPDLMKAVTDDDVADAHLATICYFFSLVIHEAMRNQKELLP